MYSSVNPRTELEGKEIIKSSNDVKRVFFVGSASFATLGNIVEIAK